MLVVVVKETSALRALQPKYGGKMTRLVIVSKCMYTHGKSVVPTIFPPLNLKIICFRMISRVLSNHAQCSCQVVEKPRGKIVNKLHFNVHMHIFMKNSKLIWFLILLHKIWQNNYYRTSSLLISSSEWNVYMKTYVIIQCSKASIKLQHETNPPSSFV